MNAELPTGEWAYVVHPTDSEWCPYVKVNGEWYELEFNGTLIPVTEETVKDYISDWGMEVVFAGVPGRSQ